MLRKCGTCLIGLGLDYCTSLATRPSSIRSSRPGPRSKSGSRPKPHALSKPWRRNSNPPSTPSPQKMPEAGSGMPAMSYTDPQIALAIGRGLLYGSDYVRIECTCSLTSGDADGLRPPGSSMRLRARTAIAISVWRRRSVREHSASPITRFRRLMAVSTKARGLYPDRFCEPVRPCSGDTGRARLEKFPHPHSRAHRQRHLSWRLEPGSAVRRPADAGPC